MNKATYRLLRILGTIMLTLTTFHNVHASTLPLPESPAVTSPHAIYYVSKNGNNQDGLSWNTAWNELNQVNWNSIQTPATIFIDGGTSSMTYYTAMALPSGLDDVTITKGITTGHNGEVIIDGRKSLSKGISINGRGSVSKNIQISDLTLKSFTSYGIYGDGENSGGLQNITVDHCGFIDFRRAGVFFEGNGNVENNYNIVVKNSYFNDDNSYTGQSDGIYVQKMHDFTADSNIIILDNNYLGREDLHSDNIQAYWVDDITYSNNIVVQKSQKTLGTQMLFASEGNGIHTYVNNVFYRDCPNARDSAIRLKSAEGGTFVGRVYGNTYIGYGRVLGSGVKTAIKNNLFYRLDSSAYYTTGSGSDVSNNLFTSQNPGFIDTSYNTFDLHLQQNSPAIDGGVSLGVPYNVDKDGNPRPQGSGYDIGAYEYSGDVRILTTNLISGNAGTAGVTLSYTDGTDKKTTSQADGSYSLPVSYDWSGTVTPSHACFTFDPANRSYSSVRENQILQDYTPTFDPSSGCANVGVNVSGSVQGNYGIPSGGQVSPSFAGKFAGPVEVVSTNGQDLIVSERQMYGSSFTETLGMPDNQLTTDYWFPWYDGKTMSTWISIGAPDTNSADAQVDIYIGGVKMNTSPYVVSAGGQVSPTFPGMFAGPVEVVSTNGQDLIVSERQMYESSFTETLGMLDNQLVSAYWFPWYDGQTMSTWISIGAP